MSDEPGEEELRSAIAEAEGSDPGDLGIERLPGGASRDLWTITTGDGARLVLRRDPPGEDPQTSREAEFTVQRAAYEAGVPVPRPLLYSPAGGSFGTAGMLMEWVEGESIARRVLRDDGLAEARAGLASELGRALAAAAEVDVAPLERFAERPADPCATAIALVRETLDATGEDLPALELGLRWLELNLPEPVEPGLVHGDFRLGNFILGPDGLRAIIDWEFWHLGDPVEDVAWVRARPWRFGRDDREVAGVGEGEDLLSALGREVAADRLRWWDVMSQVKWGAYCARQAALQREGGSVSLERVVLARRVAEAEWDMLELIGWGS